MENETFNPFVPFGLADASLDDVIKMPQKDLIAIYRRLAREVHPDKASPDDTEEATKVFQQLQRAKSLLLTSFEARVNAAQYWLLTEREKAVRQRDATLRQHVRHRREEDAKVGQPDRPEAMPAVVLCQGALSQALRSNQRVSSRGASSSEQYRLAVRQSADDLHRVRARIFQPARVPREASEQEKTEAHKSFVKKVAQVRTDKKLSRAFAKVSVDKARASAEGKVYSGPSEAGWKRTGRNWTRAGVHNETLKPTFAARRVKREQRREMERDIDPDNADMDPTREQYRAYRRRQQQRPDEGMHKTKPPHRAKKSSSRKKVVATLNKRNLRLRKIRVAALKFLRGSGAQSLSITGGDAGACVPTISVDGNASPNTKDDCGVISNSQKRTRRGGKAAKRSSRRPEQTHQTFVAVTSKPLPQLPRFLVPQPKWTARPTH